jgi:hypothetical protein
MVRDTMPAMVRRMALALLLGLPGGCSADAADEPEPTLETPGAFIALADDEGTFQILRTLAGLEVGSGQDIIFFTLFEPKASDFEQARELARDRELPVSDPLVLVPKSDVLSRTWKVVWFRTLNEEERSVLR